jgi:hypothetical protein
VTEVLRDEFTAIDICPFPYSSLLSMCHPLAERLIPQLLSWIP